MKRMDRSLTASAPSDPTLSQGVDIARCEMVTAAHHALFGPLHYEANYAYPLLVWLHGAADSERQLPRIMPMVSMRNYVAIAPRGTTAVETSGQQQGYGWNPSRAGVLASGERVAECIAAAQRRFHVAPSRVFWSVTAPAAAWPCGWLCSTRTASRVPPHWAVLSRRAIVRCGVSTRPAESPSC